MKTDWARRLLGAAALALLPAPNALAIPELQLVPDSYSFVPGSGGGTETISVDVTITGLDNVTAVAGYDFGIIYDPARMVLTNFSGFTDKLGTPDNSTVYNEDYLGDVNSLWDYRAPHPDLGAYTGPVLGTPGITGQGQINQGSLRFTQLSYLDRSALMALQDYAANSNLLLFTLTFQVDTGSNWSSSIRFVDDRDYAGYPGIGSLLDIKLSTPTDPNAETPSYLTRTGVSVEVPEPASLILALVGLGVLGARRAKSAPISRLRVRR
ncbi:PEP-CTERM sorting domain-containing protein [uncultured Thiodictyon sp.]|jgi:hypothetical protein|uniref:PEP-CTERM sorting domain-containing protein n=1 Tax=uncultured Thiodictyon sp. TaxID=1846217 RepID=UPI0025D3D2A6|nr:PEP-CTERM sorting domain-containing protein [uncultured Thiodictyon sp.]